jgi:hypothetical protein
MGIWGWDQLLLAVCLSLGSDPNSGFILAVYLFILALEQKLMQCMQGPGHCLHSGSS